jgi:hypothetical protein
LTKVKLRARVSVQHHCMMGRTTHTPRALKRAALWWRNRREASRALAELERMPYRELGRTAHDFGVSTARLGSIAARGPLAADLTQQMARAYGIAPEALERADRHTLRDLQENCAFCAFRLRCALDLAEDPASARHYCRNARTFLALRG